MFERTILPLLPWLILIGFWVYLIRSSRRSGGRAGAPLRHINPEALGKPKGYTNAVQAPPGSTVIFLAGQTARGADQRIVAGGMARQWDQALANVLVIADAAGAKPTDIVRMTVFVTDLDAYRAAAPDIGVAWRERIGLHYPAMTLVAVTGLVDDGAVVEIEATAVIA
jgi:enamine deaminase RidA (YjgF/YER057c/UK114 family)